MGLQDIFNFSKIKIHTTPQEILKIKGALSEKTTKELEKIARSNEIPKAQIAQSILDERNSDK